MDNHLDPTLVHDWRSRSLVRKVHSINARILGLFIVFHLANHIALMAGPSAHTEVMASLRMVYRVPVIEAVILLLFLVQVLAGGYLVYRNWKPNSTWSWLQVLSGGYLVFFLAQHIVATLNARWSHDLDTNVFFAASVVSSAPLAYYFIPYYFLAVLAIFTHIAAAFHFKGFSAHITHRLPVVGAVLGFVIVASLSGLFHDMTLPQPYQEFLESLL